MCERRLVTNSVVKIEFETSVISIMAFRLIVLVQAVMLLADLCDAQAPLVRLVNGTRSNNGRVEVYLAGQWGTVCDDLWDINDGHVVCRQLGFPGAESVETNAFYGRGEDPVQMDNVECAGSESSLFHCDYVGSSSEDCSHDEDTGVTCTPSLRLADGSGGYRGRVEVYVGGEWGTVCDDAWDIDDGQVVCRQLGFPGVESVQINAEPYGPGTGLIQMDDVACAGNETSLSECHFLDSSAENCNHNEDAGVVCVTVRLVGGPDASSGRVEVYLNDQWGTVCDDHWGTEDGDVVCRQLGFPDGAESVRTNAYYGVGEGLIQMDDVACTGTESGLLDCAFVDSSSENCNHLEDAGVICTKVVRLADGDDGRRGRVEVYLGGEWGTVCDDDWDIRDGHVVCRQLGFSGAESVQTGAEIYGEGTGLIQMDNVACTGPETSLLDCGFVGSSTANCGHHEDAGVVCIPVRLVNGTDAFSGRVEVYLDDQWGTVCDDHWRIEDGEVVCRQLGFPGAESVRTNAFYGVGEGLIQMDDVTCEGSETNLLDCTYVNSSSENCNHQEDAGVDCLPPVRLADGSEINKGRVEVYLGGAWGTVCDDYWDINDGHVVCRQLGFPAGAESVQTGADPYGEGEGPIQMDDVVCTGAETSVFDCGFVDSSAENCAHTEDAGVVCIPVRLANSTDGNSGRVEVLIGGLWGTVCDDFWDLSDGNVICRQLGFSGASSVKTNAFFGEGEDPIQLDDVACTGTEDSVLDCGFVGSEAGNCAHTEDAGVICY